MTIPEIVGKLERLKEYFNSHICCDTRMQRRTVDACIAAVRELYIEAEVVDLACTVAANIADRVTEPIGDYNDVIDEWLAAKRKERQTWKE